MNYCCWYFIVLMYKFRGFSIPSWSQNPISSFRMATNVFVNYYSCTKNFINWGDWFIYLHCHVKTRDSWELRSSLLAYGGQSSITHPFCLAHQFCYSLDIYPVTKWGLKHTFMDLDVYNFGNSKILVSNTIAIWPRHKWRFSIFTTNKV